MSEYEKVVGLYDLHVPFHDRRAFQSALAFVRHVKPHRVVIGGDWLDFYQLSRFINDPGRKLQLQDDIDACRACVAELRRCARGAKIFYLLGNHEARLQKHLWGTESPLTSLRGLRVPQLLDLPALGVQWVESGILRWPSMVFKHGNIVRAKAGDSAKAEMERLWRSGVSGHTHRLAQVYRRNDAGAYTWVEAGCLCDLDPEYAEGQVMDWQHGLVYAEVEKGGNRFTVHPVPIVKGRIVFGGKEIR